MGTLPDVSMQPEQTRRERFTAYAHFLRERFSTGMLSELQPVPQWLFLDVLGIQPGDRIAFFIEAEGTVTVKGVKKEPAVSQPSPMSETLQQGDVTQATLFGAEVRVPAISKRRGEKR